MYKRRKFLYGEECKMVGSALRIYKKDWVVLVRRKVIGNKNGS